MLVSDKNKIQTENGKKLRGGYTTVINESVHQEDTTPKSM